MPEEKARYSRLLFIDQQIANGSYPNAVQLAADYEVSDRTIKRDIEYMRDLLDAPIEFDYRHNGYFFSEPNWRLPALTITESELFAITLASDVLVAYRNSPLYGKLSRVFDKLAALLPEKVSIPATWLEHRFSVFHTATSRIDPATWEVVLQALRENRSMVFGYTAVGYKTAADKIADPYHCIGYRGEWYLIGHDHMKADLRIYALSRMQAPRLGKATFDVPEDFDPSTHVDRHFGISLKTASHKVRIRFDEHLAFYIRERQWHESQILIDLPDGAVELRFTTNQLDAVRFWSQSWGAGVVVLEPVELREMVVEDLNESLAAYETHAPNPTTRREATCG
jgi:predicted DNA-binding transcriptional regulator YafY